MTDQNLIPTPYFIVYEDKLRRNLELIQSVSRRTGAEIIMAFKANALWKTFPLIRRYINGTTASSVNEMQLAHKHMQRRVHVYCPVYTDETFPLFLQGASHITFNTLTQYHRFAAEIEQHNARKPQQKVSAGLRVNPQCSVIETDIYNPCVPGSRFGVTSDIIGPALPAGVEGLHFHALCEGSADDLQKVLAAFEEQYGRYLPHVKWVNMGGGHLMSRSGYDVDKLVDILNDFKQRYPHLRVIMEPGSAFCWRTGDLVTTVVDVVENRGIRTGIIDASFACHMPDTLEMPYQPAIIQAFPNDETRKGIPYRLGGNSCLSGDWAGPWRFPRELAPGDRLTLEDMNHYTTVKTTMFNGLQHPSIWYCHTGGELECLRKFDYEDYELRMD